MKTRSKQIADLLKMLANENRLMVLCALMDKPMNVTSIGEHVPNITQSALSQHLALLKAHGILDCNKEGQNIIYFIKDKRVEEIINVLKKYYCN